MDRDRILGCIIGGAIGDAMGGPWEGRKGPVAIDWDMPWAISDDTQLTLATCEAIVEHGAVDPAVIAARMAAWFRERRITGIGASTYKALCELDVGGHWALVGAKGEHAAGNGAAMRIAPLAFCLSHVEHDDRRTIRDVSRITHHSEEAYVGALTVVVAIRMAVVGEWQGTNDLLSKVVQFLPDSRVRDRIHEIDRCFAAHSLIEIAQRFGASGYVVDSVPLAIAGAQFIDSQGFSASLESLIATGGDTDTIASIAGQIMGTYCGYNQLP